MTVTITTITSRDFNQNVNGAKKSARSGPVFTTNREKPSYVLLSIDQYKELAGGKTGVVDLLAMPEAGEIEFEPPKVASLTRPATAIQSLPQRR